MYGATWEILEPSLGQKYGPLKVSLGAPLKVTYLYIRDELPDRTLWRIDSADAMVHFRFPKEVEI